MSRRRGPGGAASFVGEPRLVECPRGHSIALARAGRCSDDSRWRCAQTNRSGRPRQRPPGHSGVHDRGYPRGRSEICGKPGGCCRSCGVDGDELTRVLEFRIQFPPAKSLQTIGS